jgi:hypothetical protein
MKLGDKFLANRAHFYLFQMSQEGKNTAELWTYAKTHNVIGFSWDIVKGDWNDFLTGLGVLGREAFWEHYEVLAGQFDLFCNHLHEDEIVVVVDGLSTLLGVGRLIVKDPEHPYRYEPDLRDAFFDHVRDVQWEYKAAPVTLANPLLGFTNTILKVEAPNFYWLRTYDINLPQ